MNLLRLASLLVCSGSLVNWTNAFPIGSTHQDLRGDISTEPNVVMQSVVVGKKPEPERIYSRQDCSDCPKYSFSNMNFMLKKLFHILQPDLFRFKRDDSKKLDSEAFDDRMIERLIDAIEDWKHSNEKKKDLDLDDIREIEQKLRRVRSEAKRAAWEDEEDEGERKWRKRESDHFRRILKGEEEYPRDKKERRWKKDKRREDQERRRADLADSWPRRSAEDRTGEDLFLPLPYHHQPSHHRLSGEYVP